MTANKTHLMTKYVHNINYPVLMANMQRKILMVLKGISTKISDTAASFFLVFSRIY